MHNKNIQFAILPAYSIPRTYRKVVGTLEIKSQFETIFEFFQQDVSVQAMKTNLLSHNLAVEFPELADAIHHLKMSDAHFQKMLNDHDHVDTQITKSEEGLEFLSDDEMKDLKIKRLHLKESLQKAAETYKRR